MKNHFITEKFTLVPTPLYSENYLAEMFKLDKDEEIKSIGLDGYNATLAYAAKTAGDDAGKLPVVHALIQMLNGIPDHNRIVVHYCNSKKLLHIVAAEKENLLLANTYSCTHINTLLYFLTLVCQQVMFNPQITGINLAGKLEKNEEALLLQYFQKITYKD